MLLTDPAVDVCVVATPEVWLLLPPKLALVTVKVTVQLPLVGIKIPVKLRAVWPPLKEVGVVPVQVPPTDPAAVLMLDSVSVNAPPVRAEAFLRSEERRVGKESRSR